VKIFPFAIVITLAVSLSACSSGGSTPPTQSLSASQYSRTPFLSPPKHHGLGCYGTFGVEALPCPVKLTKKNGGTVTVSVNGPGVVLAVVIGSDCAGPASVCDVSQTGYTQFAISSVPGQNVCGNAYVVFEGVTASGTPVGTATVKVINKYC